MRNIGWYILAAAVALLAYSYSNSPSYLCSRMDGELVPVNGGVVCLIKDKK